MPNNGVTLSVAEIATVSELSFRVTGIRHRRGVL